MYVFMNYKYLHVPCRSVLFGQWGFGISEQQVHTLLICVHELTPHTRTFYTYKYKYRYTCARV